uniref:uncharacterized protein LOC122585160 n=1 Tax=Erigeron canadensis TaxID=72917 RepID=UPI001CB90B65|nr:uncharacterized protein LOC122585160 [Erigeron canadensis]
MMVSLACLQKPDCSKVLFKLLTGSNNIAGSLPEKFVYHLLSKKKGRNLHLCPQIVAEAFMSIEDPLLIASSGKPYPKTNAPDATFVDLKKSKEEIASALFSRTAVCCQFSSDNDECETILEARSSKTLSNEKGPVYTRMNHISVDLCASKEEIISKLLSRKALDSPSDNDDYEMIYEENSDENDECGEILEAPSSSNTSSNTNVHSNPKSNARRKIPDDNKKLLFSFIEQMQPPSIVEKMKRLIISTFEGSEDEAESEPEFKNPHVKGGKKKAVQAMAKRGAGEEQAKRLMDDAFVEDVCKLFLENGGSSKTSGADEAAKSTKGKGKTNNKKGKKKKN